MYQRKVINNHKTFTTQNHYFTYQRTGNQELEVQASNMIVSGLQAQINNLTSSVGSEPNPDIGLIQMSS